MDAIRKWFIGDMGTPGAYEYTTMHYVVLGVVIVGVIACWILGASKRIKERDKKKILIGIAIFQLAFEVFWRVIYMTVKKASLKAPLNAPGHKAWTKASWKKWTNLRVVWPFGKRVAPVRSPLFVLTWTASMSKNWPPTNTFPLTKVSHPKMKA